MTIEDEVFVGHDVMFINDRFPRATTDTGGWVTAAVRLETRTHIPDDDRAGSDHRAFADGDPAQNGVRSDRRTLAYPRTAAYRRDRRAGANYRRPKRSKVLLLASVPSQHPPPANCGAAFTVGIPRLQVLCFSLLPLPEVRLIHALNDSSLAFD